MEKINQVSKDTSSTTKHVPYMKRRYLESVESIAKELNVTNNHEVPKLKSVTLHARYGKFLQNSNKKRFVLTNLTTIAGQLAVEVVARRSIAQYKVRAGMICGCKVTLRKDNAYEFLTRLWISLPRSRNFDSFDTQGIDAQNNFNFGIADHSIFEGVDSEENFGFDVCVATTATSKAGSKRLLEALGMPFKE